MSILSFFRSGGPRGDGMLRRDYLSPLENVAQAIGTMGPAATLGTIMPLLISKSGNGTSLLFLGILGVFVLISLSINVFASRLASAGSLEAYTRMGLGNGPGIVAGWSYVVALAFIVVSSGVSGAYYFGMVLTRLTGVPVGALGSAALVVLVVALAWWPAYRDVKLSTKIMLSLEGFSVALILLILTMAMWKTHHWVDRPQLVLEGASFPRMQLGFVLAFMMLAGFESASTLGEEARAATRNIPRAMYICLLPTALLFMYGIYCMTALSHYRALALDQTDAPLDLVAQSIGWPLLGLLSSLGVAISCLGCAVGGFNAGSRVIFSMARQGLFPARFGAAHPVNGTPSAALALFAVLAMAVPAVMLGLGVTMAGAMDYLMQIASFGFIVGYFAVCLAAPFYLARHRLLGLGRTMAAIVTLGVIGAVLVMSVLPVPAAPWRYLPYIFAGLLLAGSGVTAWCRRRGRPDEPLLMENAGLPSFAEPAEPVTLEERRMT